MKAFIFDFETLSRNPSDGVVLSMSFLGFDTTQSYTYDELVNSAFMIKFNVQEQIKRYHRKIEMETLKFWESQSDHSILKPSNEDQSIQIIDAFIRRHIHIPSVKAVFSRGYFDQIYLESLLGAIGATPIFDWWAWRDTRSFIEGLSFGTDIRHDFILDELKDKFKKHDPRHDIAMDVSRMQFLQEHLSQ